MLLWLIKQKFQLVKEKSWMNYKSEHTRNSTHPPPRFHPDTPPPRKPPPLLQQTGCGAFWFWDATGFWFVYQQYAGFVEKVDFLYTVGWKLLNCQYSTVLELQKQQLHWRRFKQIKGHPECLILLRWQHSSNWLRGLTQSVLEY